MRESVPILRYSGPHFSAFGRENMDQNNVSLRI